MPCTSAKHTKSELFIKNKIKTSNDKIENITTSNAQPIAPSVAPSVQPIAPSVTQTDAEKIASFLTKKTVTKNHELTTAYSGASAPFNARKSSTKITAIFNSFSDYPLTERDNAFLNSLFTKYQYNPFPRLNADAGNLRRAIERGALNYGETPNTFVITPAFK